jgi:3-deoxy-7-phosphoheptulonate synthase
MASIRSSGLNEIRDRRIERAVPLVTPARLLEELPLDDDRAEVVLRGRRDVAAILTREDERLLAVVGPCSVHDVDAALEYARRLREQAAELEDDLLLAMRVYFEKPRTTIGWKGLINDPHLDGSGDVNTGLRRARELLLAVLDLHLPIALEFLDPITPQYISDTVAWGAIGARTVESQIHRQLGSGLSMPVGFKNRTDGNLQVAVDACRSASAPHTFPGVDVTGTAAIMHTRGNPDCHVILRGGRGAPNYGSTALEVAVAALRRAGLPERLVVDASHDNSGKDPERQLDVGREIAEQVGAGNDAIVGVMLESFIVGGSQRLEGDELVYGQSITDPCMDWDQTVSALAELAAAVRRRRAA